MDERTLAWLKLGRATVRDAVKRAVLSRFPDPDHALQADLTELDPGFQATQSKARCLEDLIDQRSLDRDIAWCGNDRHVVVGISDGCFPPLLREVSCPPVVLYCAGDLSLFANRSLAIVGARKPTPAGREISQRMAAEIGATGVTITSGLAVGIDSAAHRGALPTIGSTIAVCATGLDTVYPQRNVELAREIAEKGLLVSEFAPGTGVRKRHFPQRNRVISGLSSGVMVVEAQLGSGSLITAGFAADQSREVFAVPGSVYSPLSSGPHRLIREGACLVETSADVLETLGWPSGGLKADVTALNSPAWCAEILAAVDYAPTSINQIVERSGLTIGELCAMLIKMESAGLVRSVAGLYARMK